VTATAEALAAVSRSSEATWSQRVVDGVTG
jgi:hypothetical protein